MNHNLENNVRLSINPTIINTPRHETCTEELIKSFQKYAKEQYNYQEKNDIEKMGISNELTEFEGLNPSILVKLGNANIKTIDNLADLASDELKEILEDISISSIGLG